MARPKKIETFEWEDGSRVDIHLDRESGAFYAGFSSSFQDDDGTPSTNSFEFRAVSLPALRQKLCAWFKEHTASSWEPVIILESSSCFRDSLPLDFSRAYRSPKRKKGEYAWRQFYPVRDQSGAEEKRENPGAIIYFGPQADGPNARLCLGIPGVPIHSPGESVLPYTPERWQTLLRLRDQLKELRGRLEAFAADPKEVARLLDAPGARLLGPAQPRPGVRRRKKSR